MNEKIIYYTNLNQCDKIFIGYTVPDCQLINHLLGHFSMGDWHEGTFSNTTLHKLQHIAKMHGYVLKYEKRS